MTCTDIAARLHAYVDGELTVGEIAAVDAHCLECRRCAELMGAEREFRALLRRQPREAAPADLRTRIMGRIQREARTTQARRWLTPVAALAAAVVIVAILLPWSRPTTPLVADLVDKHIAYAQIERPAELASSDRTEVAEWFMARAGMRVTVPDFSPSGIRLVGSRLADAHERKAAYLLYEKGRTLLSVFIVPLTAAEGQFPGRRVGYRGHEYVAYEQKGFRTVSWADDQTLFGLVSTLDYEALLECADRLRQERRNQTRL
jgi:mycothiol system anti-sigma-R factor